MEDWCRHTAPGKLYTVTLTQRSLRNQKQRSRGVQYPLSCWGFGVSACVEQGWSHQGSTQWISWHHSEDLENRRWAENRRRGSTRWFLQRKWLHWKTRVLDVPLHRIVLDLSNSRKGRKSKIYTILDEIFFTLYQLQRLPDEIKTILQCNYFFHQARIWFS